MDYNNKTAVIQDEKQFFKVGARNFLSSCDTDMELNTALNILGISRYFCHLLIQLAGCPCCLFTNGKAVVPLSFLGKAALKLSCAYARCGHTACCDMVSFILRVCEETLWDSYVLLPTWFSTATLLCFFYRKLKAEVFTPLSSYAIQEKHLCTKMGIASICVPSAYLWSFAFIFPILDS